MADEYYWTYKAASPTPSYQEALDAGAISPNPTESGCHSLTPGLRREIVHAARKKGAASKARGFRFRPLPGAGLEPGAFSFVGVTSSATPSIVAMPARSSSRMRLSMSSGLAGAESAFFASPLPAGRSPGR